MADYYAFATSFGSLVSNGQKCALNYKKDPLGDVTAAINFASAAQNAIALLQQLSIGDATLGTKIVGNLLNKFNFAAQVAALGDAINKNDSQGIAKGIIGVIGSVAGIIGSIPGLPPQISLPAKAVNLLASAVSLNISNPEVWTQISDTLGNLVGDESTVVDVTAITLMLNEIDPNVTAEQLNNILHASAPTNTNLEELSAFSGALSKLLTPNSAQQNSSSASQLYSNISNTLQIYKANYGNSTFAIVAPPTSASEARSDLGAFLSLYYLTPFALKANDAGALNQLYLAHEEVAGKWAADKTLTAEQIAQGKAFYSDNWLTDRAAMLSWQVQISNDDAQATESSPYLPFFTAVPSQYFQDVTTGQELFLGGIDRRRIIFGSDSGESIYGRGNNDRLYGGGGADTAEDKMWMMETLTGQDDGKARTACAG
jgi:hypothetical protein